ncbi:MAG: YHS domain-containing protein [Thermoanaerobaculia bacterium]
MKSGIRTAMVLVAVLTWAGVSLAQHEGHQMGGAPTGEGACLAYAKEGLRIVENANRQLEEARQINSPQQMRAAISELQTALAEIRTQLSLCVRPAAGGSGKPGMEGMDHSGMKGMDPSVMEGMDHSKMGQEKPPAPKSQKPPSAQMDHSKMEQSKMDDPKMDHSKMGEGKPAAPKSEKPPSAEMDHSKMGEGKPAAPSAAQAKDSVDPVCGMEVGTQAAEKATYQGKTYYFCSRADREKFLSDPAKYVNR